MVLTLVLLGTYCHAQSWSDMTSWFRYEGVEILAVYAHPLADMADYEIVSVTSNSIVVEIDFEGVWSDYTSKYEIVKGMYNGQAYFQTVRVLSDDFLGTSFVTWSEAPKLHSMMFDEFLGSSLGYELYGAYSFEDLSLGKMAAFGLFMEFIKYYDD